MVWIWPVAQLLNQEPLQLGSNRAPLPASLVVMAQEVVYFKGGRMKLLRLAIHLTIVALLMTPRTLHAECFVSTKCSSGAEISCSGTNGCLAVEGASVRCYGDHYYYTEEIYKECSNASAHGGEEQVNF
jgi:hypothetical protein